MILSYQTIRQSTLVSPMSERTVTNGFTFGIGPSGYDVRISESVTMWPGRFVLASTIEKFKMPLNIMGMVCDKSTWIRRGVSVHNTVIEPGWHGYLTLELKMVAFDLIKIRGGSPIAQIVFSYLDCPTEAPYCGKYQNQKPGAQKAILEVSDVV